MPEGQPGPEDKAGTTRFSRGVTRLGWQRPPSSRHCVTRPHVPIPACGSPSNPCPRGTSPADTWGISKWHSGVPDAKVPPSPLTRHRIYSLGVEPKSHMKLTGALLATQTRMCSSDCVWTALSPLGSFCPCFSLDPRCKKALTRPHRAVPGLRVPKPNRPSFPDLLSSAHSLGKHRLLRPIFSIPSIIFFSSPPQENFSQDCSAASKSKP